MNRDLSIIIYSCWKNRDMWRVFSILFWKYWSDCEFSVVLVTDAYEESMENYVFSKVVVIDDNWAKMIKKAMKEAGTPYVMLFMDDYLLCDRVTNEQIKNQIERIKLFHAANLRLVESPKCFGKYMNSETIGYYRRGDAYSLSTQVGIWDVSFLNEIINDEWSAWDFERIASVKNRRNTPILVSLDYVFPYEEGVRKGKWMIAGEKLCIRNGIQLDYQKRPVMTNLEMAKIYFQGAIIDINPNFVIKIQNWVNRLRREN